MDSEFKPNESRRHEDIQGAACTSGAMFAYFRDSRTWIEGQKDELNGWVKAKAVARLPGLLA